MTSQSGAQVLQISPEYLQKYGEGIRDRCLEIARNNIAELTKQTKDELEALTSDKESLEAAVE